MKYEYVNNGSDLKEMLNLLNLSKIKFAKLCGVSRQTIDNVCNNKYNTSEMLLKLINYVIRDYIKDNDLILVTETLVITHYVRRNNSNKNKGK